MKDKANAKINLSLDVFNVREDGYHDLKSIMLPLNFYDELEIRRQEKDEYICNRSYIRFDESNSIIKMINAFSKKYNINDHYYVNLIKHIPVQAGLGGGTSDAASTLRILQRMYHIDMSQEEIRQLCVEVGADVMFSYYNLPAVVEGIGDIVNTFEVKNDYYVLLIKPNSGVSTKTAYELLNMKECDHPDIDKLKHCLINGESLDGLLGNSLEEPSFKINKDIKEMKDKLIKYGATNVLMSGSGSTVFALSEDKEKIGKLYNYLYDTKYFIRYAKVIKNK